MLAGRSSDGCNHLYSRSTIMPASNGVGRMNNTVSGAKTAIRVLLSVKKKVKVPIGSDQRRSARKTKLMVNPVSNRISVIPRVAVSGESKIGHGFTRGCAYSVK